MISSGALCYLALVSSVISAPISQPTYSGIQYSNSQSLTAQQSQPSYITAPQPAQPQAPLYQTQSQAFGPPTQVVSQLLLPTNVDRQIQQAAQYIAGPQYAQQIQIAQQQELSNQAVVAAQRRAMRQRQLAEQERRGEFTGRGTNPAGGLSAQLRAHSYTSQPVAQAQTPQEYQIQYQPQTARPIARAAAPQQAYPRPKQPLRDEDLEEYDVPSSYKFGFDVTDDQNTNYQNRQEQRDGHKISGSYSVVDSDGFIRTVTYTADPKEGFKAEVVRKPTDIVVKIPSSTPSPREQYVQGPRIRGQESKGNVIYQYQ